MKFSYSAISTYKACKRLFQLRYLEGWKYIGGDIAALNIGIAYHDAIGEYLKTGDYKGTGDPKIDGMVEAFKKYSHIEIDNGLELEKFWEHNRFYGYFDGQYPSTQVIEHKTTSDDLIGPYTDMLAYNEQAKLYMLASNNNNLIFTMIKKPTIRQKQSESPEEFTARVVEWYADMTENKILATNIHHSWGMLLEFEQELLDLVDEIDNCTHFWRNYAYCNKWGRMCEYYPICHSSCEDSYVNFERAEETEILR